MHWIDTELYGEQKKEGEVLERKRKTLETPLLGNRLGHWDKGNMVIHCSCDLSFQFSQETLNQHNEIKSPEFYSMKEEEQKEREREREREAQSKHPLLGL